MEMSIVGLLIWCNFFGEHWSEGTRGDQRGTGVNTLYTMPDLAFKVMVDFWFTGTTTFRGPFSASQTPSSHLRLYANDLNAIQSNSCHVQT